MKGPDIALTVNGDRPIAASTKPTNFYSEPLLVAGPKMSIDKNQSMRLQAGEVVRLPFVRVGEFNFRDSYGPVAVTTDDLDVIVRNFKNDARRQDLPLLVNEEHAELPEGADPKQYIGPGAVGWIKDLVHGKDVGLDPLTVYADAELNRLGEQVYRDDRYRAVSPELLLRWVDPETDQDWGKTAAGLAFTTMPKMKGLAQRAPYSGKVAASENARVLAFAESPGHGFRGNQHFGGVGRHVMGMGGDDTRAHLIKDHGITPRDGASKGSLQNAHLIAHTHAGKFADLASVHIDGPMTNLSIAQQPNKLNSALPGQVQGNGAGDGPPDIQGEIYAFPQQKRLPLSSAAGVRGALARFMTVEASEKEREVAWQRVMTAGDRYGVTVPKTWRELKASECIRILMAEGGYEQQLHGDAYQQAISGLQSLIQQEVGEGESRDAMALMAIWAQLDDWWSDELSEFGDGDGYDQVVNLGPSASDEVDPQPEVLPSQAAGDGRSALNTGLAALAGGAAAPWATSNLPDLSASEMTTPTGGSAVTTENTTPEATPAPAASAAAPAAAPVVEPSVDTASKADMAETQNLLKAAEQRAANAEAKAAEAIAMAETLKAAEAKRVAAEKQAKTIDRIKNLVKTGRITPATEAKFAEQVAKFSESEELAETFLSGLELLPENSAVDMRERGTSEKGPEGQNEGERLAIAVHTLMSERKQSTDPKDPKYFDNYKAALLEVSRPQR